MANQKSPFAMSLVAFITFLVTTFPSFAQDSNLSIGTDQLKDKAVLWLKGNGSNQGLLLPVVNNRNSFTGLNNGDDKGMLVYDLSDNKIYYWNGTAWTAMSGGTVQPGTGDITAVNAGIGLVGGADAGDASLSVDVGTTASKIVQLDVTGKLPAVDGSQLTNLPSGTTYSAGTGIQITGNTINNTGDTNAANDITNTTTAGGDLTGTYPNPTVSNGAITNAKIANGIDGAKLTDATVANAKLVDNTIALSKLNVTGTLADGKVLKVQSGELSFGDDNSGGSSFTTDNVIPKGSTSGLIGSQIFDNGTNVGIGNTSPVAKLSVTGDLAADEYLLNTHGSGPVPAGGIIMWSGLPSAIPVGYVLCDGTSYLDKNNVSRPTPNLSGRFIVGFDATAATTPTNVTTGKQLNYGAINNTGGENLHTLTTGELAAHNHTGTIGNGGATTPTGTINAGGAHTPTGTTGNGGDHNHSGSIGGGGGHDHSLDNLSNFIGTARGLASGSASGASSTSGVGDHAHSLSINNGGTHSHSLTINAVAAHTHTLTMNAIAAHTHTLTTNNAGTGQSHENRPPYFVLAYIMKKY